MKFGFSVLHYQMPEVTINCVNSILKNVPNVEVVIVDNCSPDGSGSYIHEQFLENEKVKCIKLDSNLGFAQGNNVGYSFLRTLGCEFICCVNNDVLLTQVDFVNVVLNEFNRTKFSVLAPKVVLKDKSIQSFNPILGSISEYERELNLWKSCSNMKEYIQHKNYLTKILLTYPRIGSILRKYKQIFLKQNNKFCENVVLHGCFLVFSPIFIKQFDFAFDPRTFMYREEELLYLKVISENLKTVYCPSLSIIHLEDISTNSVARTKQEKFQFMKKNQISSLTILIDTIKQNNLKGN